MGMIAGVLLTFGVFVYMFWPEKNPFVQAERRGWIICESGRMPSMRICGI